MSSRIPLILQQARWIWPENAHWDIHNCYALFRKEFHLEAVPDQAPVYLTADQSYHLYVNGRFVCRGPARGYQSQWPFDEVDLRPFLRAGRNLIAIRAHNPGFSNFQYLSQGFAGLLVAAQWGAHTILTDTTWKTRRQSGISKDTVPSSMQLFCQEHIDLRVEPQDWAELGFDDSAWPNPLESHAWNAMPWYDLQERNIPLLEEKQISPKTLVGTNHGQCASGFRRTRDVTALRSAEGLEHQAAYSHDDPLPIHVPPTGPDQFRSYLIDFDKTVVGNLSITVRGCVGGEIVDTFHTETIDSQTLAPHLVIPTHCRMAFGGRLICAKDTSKHTFFHPFGFRYLTLTVRDSATPLEIDLSLNWIGYPLERKGSFQSSDPDLESIWETCAWTQQCCSLDAYVDTPWREQAQWWGDARVQAWNTFHLNGDVRLFRRGIACIAAQCAPNGLTYGHAPTMAHTCILPDFTLIWLITLWDHYWQTGSLEPFHSHQDMIAGALEYFAKQSDPATGLVSHDPRYWLFLDWSGIFKDGFPTLLNLWLLIALEKVAALYRLGDTPQKAEPLEAWAKRLRKALSALINQEGLFCDGRNPNGEIVTTTSIHAQTLAIIAALDPVHDEARIDRILLPYVRGEIELEAPPSAYWVTYVLGVLSNRGFGSDVLAFIKRHWKPMAAHGTTWENFNPRPGVDSHSHAWSAHPLFHLMQMVGGIRQTAPGWSEIRFAPLFHGSEGGACVPSPHGPIRSHWKRQESGIHVELSLPEGVEAIVELPGVPSPAPVSGESSWLVGQDGSGIQQPSPKND